MRNDTNVVYKIENNINSDIYIGSTKYLSRRIGEHMYKLKNNVHPNNKLTELYNIDNNCFKFSVIEQTFQDNLKEREQYYIDKLKPKLNILEKSDSSLGFKHSKETIDKMKKERKGKQNSLGRIQKEETKIKIAEKRNKPILQFDKSMNFIKEWKSAKFAAISLWGKEGRRTGIRDCIKGRTNTAFGFIWKEKGFELGRIRDEK